MIARQHLGHSIQWRLASPIAIQRLLTDVYRLPHSLSLSVSL
jgi:hypothetical protein